MTSECKRRRTESEEGCIIKKHPSRARTSETLVYVGDTIDLFSLLFSQHRDFLITNDDARQVRVDDLRGKTIIVYMHPLKFDMFDGLLVETFHLIETYNELWPKGGFEVVSVPIERGDASFHSCAQERFNVALSAVPWPAVPFSDQLACDRIQRAFGQTNHWVMVSPKGKVLSMCSYKLRRFFNYYGGPDLPLGGTTRLDIQDKASIMGIINLDQLLATPHRDYLLAKDGSKVPISSLKDKVVGLYFCDYDVAPRLEAITKVYQEALNLSYDFEIVQINFHFKNRCKDFRYIDHLPLKPSCGNVPWLTLPFKDPCVRRLRRIFRCHKGTAGDRCCNGGGSWFGDGLVIIHPLGTNIKGTFFELHGADIIQHFGIEAYPFTLDRVLSLERARRRQEVKLQLLFSSAGPPLLRRRRGRGYEQVPVSHLWGKRVMILFSDHLQCRSSYLKLVSSLKSNYLKQQGLPNGDKFEVVYVSNDPESYTFDECIKKIPWLVHPYSFEFASMCRSKIFITVVKNQVPAIAAFNEDGEFLVKEEFYSRDNVLSGGKYPYMVYPTLECEILTDVVRECKFYIGLHSLLKFDQNIDLESANSDALDDN